MSEATGAVIVEERQRTAVEIQAEIAKNERDLDQCDETSGRYNREFLYNVRDLEKLLAVTPCPVKQIQLKKFDICSSARSRKGWQWENERRGLIDPSIEEEEEEKKILILQVRALFEKATISTLPSLMEEFRSLKVHYPAMDHKVVWSICNLAIEEPESCNMLSEVCSVQVRWQQNDTHAKLSRFRSALSDRVERMYRNMDDFIEREERLIDENRRNMRVKKIGIVKFLGHLYLHGVSSVPLVLNCINHLIFKINNTEMSCNNDDYAECVLRLLKMIGKRLHEENVAAAAADRPEIVPFDDLFEKLRGKMTRVSEGVRIITMDLMELRANEWVDAVEGSKKIEVDEELDPWKEKYQQLANQVNEKDGKIRMLDEKCIEVWKKLDEQHWIKKNSIISKNCEEMEKKVLIKKVRALFHKVTPTTFASLTEEFLSYKVHQSKAVNEVGSAIIDLVVENIEFSHLYALICAKQVIEEVRESGANVSLLRNDRSIDGEIEEMNSIEKQRQLNKRRRKNLGIVTIIGYFFRCGILSQRIIRFCVVDLLQSVTNYVGEPDEHAVECALQLLQVVGRRLEELNLAAAAANSPPFPLDETFVTLKGAMPIVSDGLRHAIVKLVELHKNGWVPTKTVDEGPKKLDNIKL